MRLQCAGVCSLGHHLHLCFVSSCFHNDFDAIRSLVPFVGPAQLALTFSRFERVDGGILVVRFSTCPAVLRLLLDLVVKALPYILQLRIPYLFCCSYVLTYIFLLSFIVFFLICTVLQGTCSYEDFRQDVICEFLLACSSRLGIDTCSMAWCLGSLSLPSSRMIDIVWHGPVSLVLGILQLSGSDVVCHCGIAVSVPWFCSGCFIHLPPTLP